jgi:hypothetical protein
MRSRGNQKNTRKQNNPSPKYPSPDPSRRQLIIIMNTTFINHNLYNKVRYNTISIGIIHRVEKESTFNNSSHPETTQKIPWKKLT